MEEQLLGGNVVPANAAARVDISKKCALIAVDIPNAPAKPQAFKATNISKALEQLNVSFKVQLRRLDGSAVKEKISIKSMEDFDEAVIANQSEVLREQQLRMVFLHDFQHELRYNKQFRAELSAFLDSDKKSELITFLQNWVSQMKKPTSQFLQLLKG